VKLTQYRRILRRQYRAHVGGIHLGEQYSSDLGKEEEVLGDLQEGGRASGETRNGHTSFDSAEEEVDKYQRFSFVTRRRKTTQKL
jgi:hypothetical protein